MHNSRKQMNKLYVGKNLKSLDCCEVLVSRKDGSAIRVRIYKPLHKTGAYPGVLWNHSGGYAQGVPEMSVCDEALFCGAGALKTDVLQLKGFFKTATVDSLYPQLLFL